MINTNALSLKYMSRMAAVTTLLLFTGAKGQSINEMLVDGGSSLILQSISGDGTFAGGVADFPGGNKRVVRIAKSGNSSSIQIPNAYNINVTAMSHNGGRVVGFFTEVGSDRYRGFSWAPSPDGSGALTILGPPPSSSFIHVEAAGVSADGTVVACRLISPTIRKAAKYPGTAGLYTIFDETSSNQFNVMGISANSSLLLGDYRASSSTTSFPAIVDFNTVPTPSVFTVGNQRGEICCVSSDGTKFSGIRRFPNNSTVAMRWSIQNGVLISTELGFTGSSDSSQVTAMTSNGNRIIGRSGTPFIWDSGSSIRSLRTAMVAEYGIDMSSWPILSTVGGMSADGSQIVGTAAAKSYWIDLRRPLSVTIEPAVKISYPTIVGRTYQPQHSLDLIIWNNAGDSRQGTGMIEAFYSEKTGEKKFFRVQEITP